MTREVVVKYLLAYASSYDRHRLTPTVLIASPNGMTREVVVKYLLAYASSCYRHRLTPTVLIASPNGMTGEAVGRTCSLTQAAVTAIGVSRRY